VFSGSKIYPGHGKKQVKVDGKVSESTCESHDSRVLIIGLRIYFNLTVHCLLTRKISVNSAYVHSQQWTVELIVAPTIAGGSICLTVMRELVECMEILQY
jgi:Ribosomal protein L24e